MTKTTTTATMKTTTKKSKYIFDRPDPTEAERNRQAVAALRFSGDYSTETYKERSAAARGPVASPDEIAKSRAFNRAYRRHKAKRCGKRCYWCGSGILPPGTEKGQSPVRNPAPVVPDEPLPF